MTVEDTQQSSATGSFPVAQFDSGHEPFVAFGTVPITVLRDWAVRSSMIAIMKAKAVN